MQSDHKSYAIQGCKGAFHHIAARYYTGLDSVEIVESDDFEGVLRHVTGVDKSRRGLMAIENTLFGSLLSNYQLLRDADIQIEGEVYLRIKQNLLALPNQGISELREVHSHPIAIAQCRDFFDQFPHIKLIEAIDTAGSARLIQEKQKKGVGAIASTLAADLYELDVMAESIESNKQNYTRFLVLAPDHDEILPDEKKVSSCFTVDHKVGSLYQILGRLADVGVNLTKIQSIPIIGHPWEYQFFVDFLMKDAGQLDDVRIELEQYTRDYRILGCYKKGEHHEH